MPGIRYVTIADSPGYIQHPSAPSPPAVIARECVVSALSTGHVRGGRRRPPGRLPLIGDSTIFYEERYMTCHRASIVFALSAFAWAAPDTSAVEHLLTLERAEALAMGHNPRISMARDSLARASASVTLSRSTMLPVVDLSGMYTRNVERPKLYIDGAPPVEFGVVNDYQVSLTGSQPLFLGFAGVTGVRLSRTGVAAAREQLEQAAQDVVQGVREAYLAAALSRRLVHVQGEAVAQARSSLEHVQRQYSVGAASRFDLIRAEVQLSTTRPNLVTAESNREVADARLRMAIGLDPGDVVVPADTLSRFESRWHAAALDSLLAIAYAERTDIRRLAYFEQSAGYGVDIARSGYLPYVGAFARANWDRGAGTWSRTSAMGLQLSWTVWDSRATSSRVQQARVGVRQMRTLRTLVRQSVALEVEAGQRKLAEAWVNMESLGQTVGQAGEALRLARVLYSAGASTQLDVMTAELVLTQARVQFETALYQYNVAHTRMESALGLIDATL